MNESDIQLKLLANVPIDIGIGEFQLPTIREVIRMGESKYQEHMSRLLFDKSQLSVQSDELNEYSDFEVFVNLMFHDVPFRMQAFESFRIFLNSEPNMLENGVFYFDELSEDTVLTEEKWKMLQRVIRLGNYLQEKKEEEFDFGTDEAKSFWEKVKKKRELAAKLNKKEEKINLHSIISAVGWRLDDVDKVLNKTIYQLYDAYYRFGFIDNFNFINTGIYTGNIDSSKIKLPDINWANIIKIK